MRIVRSYSSNVKVFDLNINNLNQWNQILQGTQTDDKVMIHRHRIMKLFEEKPTKNQSD